MANSPSTKVLLIAVLAIGMLLGLWAWLEPSHRDIRLLFWLIDMALVGALLDRLKNNRLNS